MKLIVTGSRDWEKEDHIWDTLRVFADDALDKGEEVTLIHGDCPTGADAIADFVAQEIGFEVIRYPADWSKGKKAGPERNRRMIDENLDADYVLAFPLGESRGTRHCMGYAERQGLQVINLGERD